MNAQVTPLRSSAETQLIEQFRTVRESLPGSPAMTPWRDTAFKVFADMGLPTRRNEAWHYTDLRAAMRNALPRAPLPGAAALATAQTQLVAMDNVAALRLVLLDGVFLPEASDLPAIPDGVTVSTLADILQAERHDLVDRLGRLDIAKGDPAFLLNAAFMRDGVIVEVAANTHVARPLRIVSLRGDGTASAARSVVVAGENARVFVIEVHAGGAGASQTNDAIEFFVGAGAHVQHAVMQRLEPTALSVTTVTADLAARATFDSFALTSGAAVSRRQLFVRFSGEHASATLNGVSLLRARQHADTTLVVDHAVPHGVSRERYRHIVDDEATGVFQGKIIVRQYAQKTDGGMKSNAILLSEGATMNNKPELEIFADDVVCGHGATCGELDDDQLFYCMARGLPRADAESLLLEAFAGEVVDAIEHQALRDVLMQEIGIWLAARSANVGARDASVGAQSAGLRAAGDGIAPAERSIIENLDKAPA